MHSLGVLVVVGAVVVVQLGSYPEIHGIVLFWQLGSVGLISHGSIVGLMCLLAQTVQLSSHSFSSAFPASDTGHHFQNVPLSIVTSFVTGLVMGLNSVTRHFNEST